MLRSLRSRLILSHILPLVIIIPLMILALIYLLETQVLIPQLTQELLDNARVLTRVVEIQPGRIEEFTLVVRRVDIDPSMRLVYVDKDGVLLYSNDPDILPYIGQPLEIPELSRALRGQEVIQTNYNFFRTQQSFAQVLFPVTNIQQEVIGVLWVTYFANWVSGLFNQLRFLSLGVIAVALLVGVILGSALALNIGNPIGKVTEAIYNLSRGEQKERLRERGPREVRELVRAINYLVERLQTLEASRRQLLANLVHELGRPLGALRSALQALGKGAGKDPKLLNELTLGMDQEAARLQHVVEELALLHEQVLGSLELKYETIDLGQWLPTVLIPWSEAANDKDLVWSTDIPDSMPEVQCDSLRLSQVVGNLVSNAVRYTPSGGSVKVSAGAKSDMVWVKVKDTGPGIPKNEQEAIFLPLYRGTTSQSRIKQGMGLGLSIAQDLIKAHNGSIEVLSNPGEGSQFTLWLPYNPIESDDKNN